MYYQVSFNEGMIITANYIIRHSVYLIIHHENKHVTNKYD